MTSARKTKTQKTTTPTTFKIGDKVKISEDRLKILYEFDQDFNQNIELLEGQLGKSRAIYVAAEQQYVRQRIELEEQKVALLKKIAQSYHIPLDTTQQWEYNPSTQEFERKG